MNRTFLASILSLAAIATAMPAAASAAPRTRVVAYNLSDLRTHEGVAKFRKQVRMAIAKVCATFVIPDFESSVEQACRNATTRDVKPKVASVIAKANGSDRLALAEPISIASR